MTNTLKLVAIGTLALALNACSTEQKDTSKTNAAQAVNTVENKSAALAAAPTDAEIAHIVTTANQIDIDNGKAALKITKNNDVRQFAKRMVAEHTKNQKMAQALAKKLNLTPEDNITSKAMMDTADRVKADLKDKKGAAYDVAYIDHEVTFHENVLAAMDDKLIPNAKNEQLKALLEQTRPVIAAHYEHARKVRDNVDVTRMR